MESSIYLPENWSIFNTTVRSNNAIESWHSRLKKLCGANVSFNKLVQQLHHEALMTKMYKKLLSEGKMISEFKAKNVYIQHQIFKIWKLFDEHDIIANEVLEQIISLLKY